MGSKGLYLVLCLIMALCGAGVYASGYQDIGDDLLGWGIFLFIMVLAFVERDER